MQSANAPMKPIIETHVQLVQAAQAEYQDAIAQKSVAGAEFWLGQLQGLCQQLQWLNEAAGPPVLVARTKSTEAERQALLREISTTTGRVELYTNSLPPPPPKPTTYNWNDGFEGVTLDNAEEEQR